MLKTTQEWGFTDRPDYVRICRELRESDCTVGLVSPSGNHSVPLTLVDWRARIWPQAALHSAECVQVPGSDGWRAYRGDRVKVFLGVTAITVRGYR